MNLIQRLDKSDKKLSEADFFLPSINVENYDRYYNLRIYLEGDISKVDKSYLSNISMINKDLSFDKDVFMIYYQSDNKDTFNRVGKDILEFLMLKYDGNFLFKYFHIDYSYDVMTIKKFLTKDP